LYSKIRSIRVLILDSKVDKVFCAGADLKERAKMSTDQVQRFVSDLRQTFTDLESLSIPTVSVINGVALGGGLEMALSTDIRIAGPLAKLGLPETKLAIIPGAGGTQRLPRLIGIARAKELIFTGRILGAKQASDIGLVNEFVEQGSVLDKALEISSSIIQGGPIALKMAKCAISKGMEMDL
jgi:methylglutaconyl-CoA hydratase